MVWHNFIEQLTQVTSQKILHVCVCVCVCEWVSEKQHWHHGGLPFINLVHWQRSPSQTAPSNISHTHTYHTHAQTNSIKSILHLLLTLICTISHTLKPPPPSKIKIIFPRSTVWMKNVLNYWSNTNTITDQKVNTVKLMWLHSVTWLSLVHSFIGRLLWMLLYWISTATNWTRHESERL